MNADYKKIQQTLKTREYAPVYLIDGEETYYLEQITNYFEDKILSPAEKDFNLTILYGKDATPNDVLNTCKRFPMFAERQVVILKDASNFKGGDKDDKGLNALLSYIEKPSPTTILLIEHPFKKADTKTRFVKRVKEKGVHFTSDKIKDDLLPDWIERYGGDIGFTIARQEAEMLASYLGSDLKKIANEVEKIRINVPNENKLTVELIQKYIGISKEYNVFEFPNAITALDKEKAYKMLSFFLANNKGAPLALVVGILYNHFSRMYSAHFVRGKSDKEAAAALGMSPYFLKDVMSLLPNWPLSRVERCLLLLAKYNTMSVGINSTASDKELMKEMVGLMLEA